MSATDVLELIDDFAAHGVRVWIDGGWAVDAALGTETRPHRDLDVVVEERDLEAAVTRLEQRGYGPVERNDTRPWNFVLGDALGHEVDFHVIALDEQGNGVYGPAENGDVWPSAALLWFGSIEGRRVASTSPEWLVRTHTGYELDETDWADVSALCERFDIPIPGEFLGFGDSALAAHPGVAHVPHARRT